MYSNYIKIHTFYGYIICQLSLNSETENRKETRSCDPNENIRFFNLYGENVLEIKTKVLSNGLKI